MPTIAATVEQIQKANQPVLFLDTCSIVDIIRAPLRPVELRGCIDAALELLELASALPQQCTLVVASLIFEEWQNNALSETENLQILLNRLHDDTKTIHECCGKVGIKLDFEPASYHNFPLASRLHDLSCDILDTAIRLEPDDGCNSRAYKRVITNTPPSRKGGQLKDCTIVEEYLTASQQLLASQFNQKLIFCTSNRRDYCTEKDILFENLDKDFRDSGLTFVTNLGWAVSELKG